MFSSRLHWNLAPNRLLETFAAKRAAGIDILDLTESNPTRAGFVYDDSEILRAFAQPESLQYQPSPRGLPGARAAVAAYYRDRGREIDPDSVFLAASTSEAYGWLFKLLANPDDEILIPQPGYPLFDFLTVLESVRPIPYSLRYDEAAGWQINFERLQAAIGPRTRAIIVVSPNNPVGAYLKQRELAALNALCADRDLALIVDEVFSDYGFSQDAARIETAVGNAGALTFVLSGLSKVAGLPQAKLGWIQISGPETVCAEAASRLEFIADTYLSVSASVQYAAPTLLAGRSSIRQQIIERLDGNHRWLEAQCARTSLCRMLKREGGWYAVLEFADATTDAERTEQLLERHNVFVHPGYFYDFAREGYVVVSLLTPPQTFIAGIQRILRQ